MADKQINYGGQAVMEGVMMRGSKAVSVAVRNPQGNIVVRTAPLNAAVYDGRLIKIPFVRGIVGLWDALGLGIKALMFSADVALDEEGEDESAPPPSFDGPTQVGMVALSLSMSIGLFFVLPAFIGGLVENWVGGEQGRLVSDIVEGIVRLLLLIGYVSLIGLMEDVKRLYGYHGAEHKTINAFEAGAELSPQTVSTYPIEHPRCGTAFLLTVVVLSILLFILLPLPEAETFVGRILWRVGSRIVLIPIIAGIAYEYLRFTARFQTNPIIKVLIRPNLALQRLTTREPDLTMIEVAIAAFEQMRSAEAAGSAIEEHTVTLAGEPT